MTEENFISVDELIAKAKEAGLNFGAGEPYNRLRYYTKMNWIPHMKRKGKNLKGHYPEWVIYRLKMIEDLRKQGLNNDEVTEEISRSEKRDNFRKALYVQKTKKYAPWAVAIIILSVLILNEIGVVKIGKTRRDINPLQKVETAIFP